MGTRFIGHDADGGIYNTYRIPFGKSVKVVGERPTEGFFWYILRGVSNYPVVLGDLVLPPSTRMRLYKTDTTLKPFEFVDLAATESGRKTGGALFQVTLATNSSSPLYLEACFRAYIDTAHRTNVMPLFLSSGTEDMFLSAYYFNRDVFHGDASGLTFYDIPHASSAKGRAAMSAYKFFDRDPVLFTEDFTLRWRDGEDLGTGITQCPNVTTTATATTAASGAAAASGLQGPPPKMLKDVDLRAYVWVYEWDAAESPTVRR